MFKKDTQGIREVSKRTVGIIFAHYFVREEGDNKGDEKRVTEGNALHE
jgi:hypothetical protein